MGKKNPWEKKGIQLKSHWFPIKCNILFNVKKNVLQLF